MKAFKNVLRNLGLIVLGVVLTLTTQTIMKNSYSTSYPELICQQFSKWYEDYGFKANGEAKGANHLNKATVFAMKASLEDESLLRLYENLSTIRASGSLDKDSWTEFALHSRDELLRHFKALSYIRDYCKARGVSK